MIRVAFRYADRRPFARLVCALRGGDSAHCEAAGRWSGADHYCVSSSWLDDGVRGKWIALSKDKWRVYEIEAQVDPEQWLLEHDDELYDVRGLFGVLFPPIGQAQLLRFCSEAVAEILGLPEPHRFDLRALEAVCARYGRRVQ